MDMDKESLYIKSWAEFFGDCFEVIGLGSLKVLFNFIKGQKNKKLYNRFIENRKKYFGNATDEEIDKYLKSLATEIKALKNQSFLTTLKNKFKGKKGINQFLFTSDIYKADDFKQILEKCSTFNNYKPFQNGMLNLFEDTVEYARKHAFEDLSDEDKVDFSLVISEVRSSEKKSNEKIEQLETIGQIVHNYSKDKAEEKTLKYTHHKCFYCGHTGSHLIWPKNNNKSDQKTIFCCACGHSYDVRVDNYTEEERKLLEEVFNEKISKLATKKDIEELLEQNRDLEEQYKNFFLNFQKTILNIFEQERQDNMSSLKDLKDKIQEQLDKCIQCIQELTKKIDNQSGKLEKINEFLQRIIVILQDGQKVTSETLELVKDELKKTHTFVVNQTHIQAIKDSALYKILNDCVIEKNHIIQKSKIELNFSDQSIKSDFISELTKKGGDFYKKIIEVYSFCKQSYTNSSEIDDEIIISVKDTVETFASYHLNITKEGACFTQNDYKDLIVFFRKFNCSCKEKKKEDVEFEQIPTRPTDNETNDSIDKTSGLVIIEGSLVDCHSTEDSIIVPFGVKRITLGALSGKKFKQITISNTVIEIEGPNSTNYTSLNSYLKNVTKIVFDPNSSLNKIPSYMLHYRSNVEIINFPNQINMIGEKSFYKCEKLRSTLQTFFSQHYDSSTAAQWANKVINYGEEWSYEKN